MQKFYLERKKHIEKEIQLLQRHYIAEKEELEYIISEYNKKVAVFKEKYNKVCFFKFDEKKKLKALITSYEVQISQKNNQLVSLKKEFDEKIKQKKKILSFVDPQPDDILLLGTEPFSDGLRPLEWRVVCDNDDVITLLTEHTVDHLSYYQAKNWVEGTFLTDVFSDSELELLVADNNKTASLPTSAEVKSAFSEKIGTTPTNSLENKIINKVKSDGIKFGYNRLQIDNSIKFNLENSHPYWLDTENTRDGFANYVGKSVNGGWITSKIGANAHFGVRVAVKIDKFKLSNYK